MPVLLILFSDVLLSDVGSKTVAWLLRLESGHEHLDTSDVRLLANPPIFSTMPQLHHPLCLILQVLRLPVLFGGKSVYFLLISFVVISGCSYGCHSILLNQMLLPLLSVFQKFVEIPCLLTPHLYCSLCFCGSIH